MRNILCDRALTHIEFSLRSTETEDYNAFFYVCLSLFSVHRSSPRWCCSLLFYFDSIETKQTHIGELITLWAINDQTQAMRNVFAYRIQLDRGSVNICVQNTAIVYAHWHWLKDILISWLLSNRNYDAETNSRLKLGRHAVSWIEVITNELTSAGFHYISLGHIVPNCKWFVFEYRNDIQSCINSHRNECIPSQQRRPTMYELHCNFENPPIILIRCNFFQELRLDKKEYWNIEQNHAARCAMLECKFIGI